MKLRASSEGAGDTRVPEAQHSRPRFLGKGSSGLLDSRGK